jgi:hypothetical protein
MPAASVQTKAAFFMYVWLSTFIFNMKFKLTKGLFVLALALALPVFLQAQKKQGARYYHLLVGTYTNGTSKGIYVYKFDTQTGKVVLEQVAEGIKDPSYIAVSADRRFVYAVSLLI